MRSAARPFFGYGRSSSSVNLRNNSFGSGSDDRSDCASQARNEGSSMRPPLAGGRTTTAADLSYDAFTSGIDVKGSGFEIHKRIIGKARHPPRIGGYDSHQ